MMQFQEIQALEAANVMHTYNRFPLALDHGEGAMLYDTEGKAYVDMTAGIGVNCLGHNYAPLVEAVSKQAAKLMQASNLFYTEPLVRAASQLTKASGMSKVFFANSGAEANEGMLKLARKYSADKYGAGRGKVLTLLQSFHGRTLATLKATGQEKFHQHFGPFPEGFDYIKPNDIADLKAHADASVCAVMMEMVQGEGGVAPLEKTYVQEAAAYCAAHDILFLVDEVQTGIGRTGSFFAYEQYGVKPDLVSAAKGLGGGVPIGAVLAAEKCASVFGPGDHGTTFGGNPLSTAAADVVLSVVAEPAFLKEVKEKGDWMMAQIEALHAPHVRAVRGLGLMIGVQLDTTELAPFVTKLRERGVLVLTAGKDVIRLLPPLVITKAELQQALDAMKEVF